MRAHTKCFVFHVWMKATFFFCKCWTHICCLNSVQSLLSPTKLAHFKDDLVTFTQRYPHFFFCLSPAPSFLPFPPLTIIIEVHLSEDLIRPLLRRGFILWHLHHRWHHLVDGLRDEREKEGERDWLGGRWQENKKDKWIQASRDPLRRLSRKEVKHNWTKKNKVTAAFKMLINSLSESPHDSLTFVAPDTKSCSLGSFSRNTHAAFVCL